MQYISFPLDEQSVFDFRKPTCNQAPLKQSWDDQSNLAPC